MQRLHALFLATLAACAAAPLVSCGPPPLSQAAERGRKVFLESSKPKCATCHQLKDAGSPKGLGPDMDIRRPSRAETIKSVTQGVGIMPAQKGILSKQEIEDVAEYLAEVAGR
ncbi:MAG: cytochrome c [Planctomycetota bacterium]